MQTLEVTDEQYAVIQQLREEISEQVVGKYGFVRERDAVQFLIDNLDGNPDIDVEIDTDLDSSATDDVAASVGAAIDGESAPDDLEEVSYIEDDSVDGNDEPAPGAATDADVVDPDDSAPEPESDAGDEDEAEPEPTDTSADEDASSESDGDAAADAGDDNGDDSSDGDGSADDDDMLDEMMSLLETHDDKWAESNAADYRYEVELPDGTTEQVQTKDDVRALLFKNYR